MATPKAIHTLKSTDRCEDLKSLSQDANIYVKLRTASKPFPDFKTFLRELKIFVPSTGAVAWTPYPFQDRVADKILDTNRLIINSARQMGITTLLTSYALWHAIKYPKQKIMMMADCFSNASDMTDKVEWLYKNVDVAKPPLISRSSGLLTFGNGSLIGLYSSRAQNTFGLTFDLLVLDNAAFIPFQTEREVWRIIEQQLSRTPSSKFIAASCPSGVQGVYWRKWHEDQDYEKELLTWKDHPERDDKWKMHFLSLLGDENFRREHQGEFLGREYPSINRAYGV